MLHCLFFFFFKQKTAYEIKEGDWSSDVCSSDLPTPACARDSPSGRPRRRARETTPTRQPGWSPAPSPPPGTHNPPTPTTSCAAAPPAAPPAPQREKPPPPPAAGPPPRHTPAARNTSAPPPSHIVRDGPTRSASEPPRKLVEDFTTWTPAQSSGTSATAMPSFCARRMINVSGMRTT